MLYLLQGHACFKAQTGMRMPETMYLDWSNLAIFDYI